MMKAIPEERLINETGTVYEALDLVGDSVRGIRARKNLILFSAGIVDNSQQLVSGMVMNESRYYRPMIDSLNAANVTVYALNLQETYTSLPYVHQTLEQMTSDDERRLLPQCRDVRSAAEAHRAADERLLHHHLLRSPSRAEPPGSRR